MYKAVVISKRRRRKYKRGTGGGRETKESHHGVKQYTKKNTKGGALQANLDATIRGSVLV